MDAASHPLTDTSAPGPDITVGPDGGWLPAAAGQHRSWLARHVPSAADLRRGWSSLAVTAVGHFSVLTVAWLIGGWGLVLTGPVQIAGGAFGAYLAARFVYHRRVRLRFWPRTRHRRTR